MRPLRTCAARSSARTVASVPLRRPMAERTASTMSASVTPRPYPTRPWTAAGLRKTSPRTGLRRPGSRLSPGSRLRERSSATRVSRRARCIPRQTCGPCANATWRLRFGRGEVEAIGVGERPPDRGSRPASESVDEVAPARSPRRRARCRWWRSGRPPRPPARGGATPRPPPRGRADRRARAPSLRRPRAGAGTRSRSSPRSSRCPPKRSTAAFDATCSRLEPAGVARRCRDEGRRRVAVERRLDGRRRAARSLAAHSPSGSSPDVIAVTSATMSRVPARAPPRDRSPRARAPPPSTPTDERPREVAPAGRPPVAARSRRAARRPRAPRAPRSGPRTASSRNGRANGSRWRRCSLAVEREHARPDDLGRREARVVDGERRRVAHRLQHEVAPRHEPRARAPAATRPARAHGAGRSAGCGSYVELGKRDGRHRAG